jgi:hypothetical protein
MISDLEIARSAHSFMARHGDMAVAEARNTASRFRAAGDEGGANTWLRIIVAIEMLRTKPPAILS